MTRRTAMKIALHLSLLALAATTFGCDMVVASESYTEHTLPRNDSDGSYIFHGYVTRSGAPVRMEGRSSTTSNWSVIKTVNATTARTYADGPEGLVSGFYWHVSYTLNQVAAFKNPSNHLAFIRFVTKDSDNDDVVLLNSAGNVDDCYFGERSRRKSPYDAAATCLTLNSIRVAFDAPMPDPGPGCPPQVPDCHPDIRSPETETSPASEPPWFEGVGVAEAE